MIRKKLFKVKSGEEREGGQTKNRVRDDWLKAPGGG